MNTKHKKYKEYLRLEEKSYQNSVAQRNLGYKELDTPILHGYNMEYVLRGDIARREDAWIYESLLENFGRSVWCKDKTFVEYSRSSKGKKKFLTPHIIKVTEREYEGWVAKFQALWKHFPSDDEKTYWGEPRKYYRCIVPDWYFKTKITKNYKTHYKVIDEVLKQEEAEIDADLDRGKYRPFSWYTGGMKEYAKMRNRSDRSHNKRALKYNIGLQEPAKRYNPSTGEVSDDMEDWHDGMNHDVQGKEFRYHHRHSAKWDRW